MYFGVDLSHHNALTVEELKQLPQAGVDFVYLKATEGLNMSDPTYQQRSALFRAWGLKQGAYHFARGRDAAREAENFLKHATVRVGDLWPVVDIEIEGSESFWTGWVREWLEAVPYPVMLYSGMAWIKDRPKVAHMFSKWWVARYSSREPEVAWTMWQYTSMGSLPNIKRRLDLNRAKELPTVPDRSVAEVAQASKLPDMILVKATDSPAVYLFFGKGDFVGVEDPEDRDTLIRAGVPFVSLRPETLKAWMQR